MIDYYNKRAEEYEEIYHREDPLRQFELDEIANLLRRLFTQRNVLELACGTGYWTEMICDDVESITALDQAENAIGYARKKNLPPSKVRFRISDAFDLNEITREYDGGFANFWFSHIPKKRIGPFLNLFHSKLYPGSPVFFADNVFIEGEGGILKRVPNEEDTYKHRILNNAEEYFVLKNYYNYDELVSLFSNISDTVIVDYGRYYWRVHYQL